MLDTIGILAGASALVAFLLGHANEFYLLTGAVSFSVGIIHRIYLLLRKKPIQPAPATTEEYKKQDTNNTGTPKIGDPSSIHL